MMRLDKTRHCWFGIRPWIHYYYYLPYISITQDGRWGRRGRRASFASAEALMASIGFICGVQNQHKGLPCPAWGGYFCHTTATWVYLAPPLHLFLFFYCITRIIVILLVPGLQIPAVRLEEEAGGSVGLDRSADRQSTDRVDFGAGWPRLSRDVMLTMFSECRRRVKQEEPVMTNSNMSNHVDIPSSPSCKDHRLASAGEGNTPPQPSHSHMASGGGGGDLISALRLRAGKRVSTIQAVATTRGWPWDMG
jgi:hypothetical protein